MLRRKFQFLFFALFVSVMCAVFLLFFDIKNFVLKFKLKNSMEQVSSLFINITENWQNETSHFSFFNRLGVWEDGEFKALPVKGLNKERAWTQNIFTLSRFFREVREEKILKDGDTLKGFKKIRYSRKCISCHKNEKAGKVAAVLIVSTSLKLSVFSLLTVIFKSFKFWIFFIALFIFFYKLFLKEFITPVEDICAIAERIESGEIEKGIDGINDEDLIGKEIKDERMRLKLALERIRKSLYLADFKLRSFKKN